MNATNETRPAGEAERVVNHNNVWANPTFAAKAAPLLARGWPVFPCAASKQPLTRRGFKDATTDETIIAAWSARWPDALVGLPTGEASGLFVLDVDRHGDADGFATLEANGWPLPVTATHRTRSDGAHHLFQHVAGLRCNAGKLGRGLDVRGDGGYVIWWPAEGLAVENDGIFADVPQWLLDALQGPPKSDPLPLHHAPDRYAQAAVQRAVGAVTLAPEGTRNDALNGAAYGLARLAAAGRVDLQQAGSALASAALAAGLPPSEVSATLRSATRAGIASPNGTGAPEPEPAFEHPLSKFVELGDVPAPPRWVLPGFIAEGVCVIAGQHGAGKTTALLPLACAAAGLHAPAYPLAPKHWRHVIYVCEDVEQARRILLGLAYGLNLDPSVLADRVHLVAAARMPASKLVRVGQEYRERCTREVDGVALPPLVALDTAAATIELESENDNAEASRAIAALKQDFAGLPVWLIRHVSKAVTKKDAALAMRGASAFEADAHQVLYLVKDGDVLDAARWLVRNKTRFEARWSELGLTSHVREVDAFDPWGEPVKVLLRWSIAQPKDTARGVLAQQARDDAKQADAAVLRMDIVAAVRKAWESGTPINRAGVKAAVSGKGEAIGAAVAGLLDGCVLYEVEIPARERANSRRGHFLIHLTDEDRDHLRTTGELPAAKKAIPPGWKKVAKAADPENVDLGTPGNGEPDSGQVDDANPVIPILVVPLGKNDGNGGNPAEAGVPPPPDSMDWECRGTAGNDGEWRVDSADVAPTGKRPARRRKPLQPRHE